jgi:hypothetical protein
MSRPEAGIDLTGLIDLHIHTAPDVVPRFADDLESARAAAEAGMRAVLLKSHVTLVADRAALAEKQVGGLRVFGGLALNAPVGGLNPAAVEVAVKMGAKQIWMPTRGTANEQRRQGKPGGLTIFTDDGRIRSTVYDILDLVREADVILGTGHLSVEETVALVRLAQERGLRKIVVTHPEAPFIRMPIATQAELAGERVFFERCYVFTMPSTGATVSVADIAAQIRSVGPDSTVLSTDFGQAANPSPVDGMRAYLAGLAAHGFGPGDIRLMAGETPARLLGL